MLGRAMSCNIKGTYHFWTSCTRHFHLIFLVIRWQYDVRKQHLNPHYAVILACVQIYRRRTPPDRFTKIGQTSSKVKQKERNKQVLFKISANPMEGPMWLQKCIEHACNPVHSILCVYCTVLGDFRNFQSIDVATRLLGYHSTHSSAVTKSSQNFITLNSTHNGRMVIKDVGS